MPETSIAPDRSPCRACRRHQHGGGGFRLRSGGEFDTRCLLCALRHGPLVRRSGLVAMVVGSVLMVINHGDTLLAGTWPAALLWKVPLTYAVPFIVATWGALSNSRVPRR